MDYPMRVYGLNVIELFLTGFLTAVAWLLFLFALVIGLLAVISLFGPSGLAPRAFISSGLVGGMLVAGTGLTGAVLGIAASGIRQNRAALDLGFALFALMGFAWIIGGLYSNRAGELVAGVVILLLFSLALFLRKQATQARFKPRFFRLREFETMIQIADTMIDADGKEVIHPIDVAIRVDHLLDDVDSPHREDIRRVLFLVEWVLPLLIFRPFPFSALGSNERRTVVEKVIGAKGLFRDVARVLKMLACVGYYGSEEGMAQVGYVPYEDRERSHVDQTPKHYPDPFVKLGAR